MKIFFKSPNTSVPIYLLLILVVSSFVPVIHVLLMTINGGVLSLIFQDVGQDSTLTFFATNVIAGVVLLWLFLYEKKYTWKVFWAVFYTCFMFPGLTYVIMDKINIDEQFYFIPILLSSVLSSGLLLAAGIFMNHFNAKQEADI